LPPSSRIEIKKLLRSAVPQKHHLIELFSDG
jgi:hypothetical protein